MDKEKVFKALEKNGIEKEEINEKFNEVIEEVKQYGVDENMIEVIALRQLLQRFKKRKFSQANVIDYQGVIIGFKRTDYGATRQFEKAKKVFAEDPQEAVEKALTNDKGEPLHMNGFNKGKPIDLTKVWTKQCLGIAKKSPEDKYELCLLNLTGEALNSTVPMFKLIKFKGTDKKNNDEILNPGNNQDPEFEVVQELSDEQVDKMIQASFTVKKFNELKEYAKENEDNFNAFVAVKGNVVSFKPSDGDMSAILNLDNPDVDLENFDIEVTGSDSITCWVSPEFPVDCNEASLDVWVFGVPRVRENDDETEEVHMTTYGIYTPSLYRRPVAIEEVEEVESKSAETKEKKDDEGWIK